MSAAAKPRSWRVQVRAQLQLLVGLLLSTALSLCSGQALRANPTPLAPIPAHVVAPLPHVANYDIEVRLNPEHHKLEGLSRISFTNTSNKPLTELYFHLYLNAFEHERTLFLRTKSPHQRGALSTPGLVEVTQLVSPEFAGKNLWSRAEAHSPSDPLDRTDIRIALPRPIAPGERVHFEMSFTSYLPEVVARTGFVKDFYLLGQWFPKLAKLESDGSWAHFPFHPYAEFYADFSDYLVTIDVPASYQVGATGRLTQLAAASPGRAIYQAQANNVVDFAWTAWNEFEVDSVDIDNVHVRILGPVDTAALRLRTIETLRRGLPYLKKRYGAYPYPDLTVVLPPHSATAVGGMEYPQFITTTGRASVPWTGTRFVELVTFHELTHQWFQSTLASNEMRYPFLDEGLTSYVEWAFLDEELQPGGLVNLPGWHVWRLAAARYAHFSSRGSEDSMPPIASSAADFKSFNQLASVIYTRTPLCLGTLARVYGSDAFEAFLSEYAARYRMKHPTPADFLSVLEAHLGGQARQQAELMLFKSAKLELKLLSVTSRLDRANGIRSEVLVQHEGELTLPYLIQVRFSDGSVQEQVGNSSPRPGSYVFHHTSPVTGVELDPHRNILLDSNFLDNRAQFGPQSSAAGERLRDPTGGKSKIKSALLSLLSWALQMGAG
jgi:hypothetical protein